MQITGIAQPTPVTDPSRIGPFVHVDGQRWPGRVTGNVKGAFGHGFYWYLMLVNHYPREGIGENTFNFPPPVNPVAVIQLFI